MTYFDASSAFNTTEAAASSYITSASLAPVATNDVATIVAATTGKTFNFATAVDITTETDATKKGYYSKFNVEGTQTFGGAVGSSLINGMSRALPSEFKTDVSAISDLRLGTYLRRQGSVTGDQASLINGIIDLVRTDKVTDQKFTVPSFNHTTRFIPIVIKTEFLLRRNAAGTGREPYYIVFDSTPEHIVLAKSASWTPKDFYGRPEPVQIYASSGSVDFSLTGMFFSSSEEDHEVKMNLEKRLFALVTPSKNHFMPSPVEVRIGDWKRFRCIVKSVSIDYQGPWRATAKNEVASLNGATAGRVLASHSPYMYEVTFNFTITSELNTVQYAEDIIEAGYNGGYSVTNFGNADLVNAIQSNEGGTADMVSDKYQNCQYSIDTLGGIVYDISGSAGSIGTVVSTESYFGNTTEYLKSIGITTDANGSSKAGAMAQITSGLTGITQTAITNKYGNQITKIFGK